MLSWSWLGRTGGEKRDKEKENQDFAFGSVRLLSLYPTLRKKKCMVVVAWGLLYFCSPKTFLIRSEERKKEGWGNRAERLRMNSWVDTLKTFVSLSC